MFQSTSPDSLVEPKQFLVFASIESDPNASTMGWLQARLTDLAVNLREGRVISVYEPAAGRMVAITTAQELTAWASRHFPTAQFNAEV